MEVRAAAAADRNQMPLKVHTVNISRRRVKVRRRRSSPVCRRSSPTVPVPTLSPTVPEPATYGVYPLVILIIYVIVTGGIL